MTEPIIGPSVGPWILAAEFDHSDDTVKITYCRNDILSISDPSRFIKSYGAFLSKEIDHLSVNSPLIEDFLSWSMESGVLLPPLSKCLKFLESVRLEAIRESIRNVCKESLDLGLPASDIMDVISSLICEKIIES